MNNSRHSIVNQAEKIVENYSRKINKSSSVSKHVISLISIITAIGTIGIILLKFFK